VADENSHSPLLCPPNEKAEREAANGVDQIDYLTELVTAYEIVEIRESHLLNLQKLAVKGIYPCAGRYRDARATIKISDSEHVPPEAAFVQSHVRELVDYINETRDKVPALERAAYALWRLNWIHPFKGGNGRTSRCLTYLVLCVDLKMMLPGLPTLPSLVYERREDYVTALKAADASLRELNAKAVPEDDDRLERRADLSVMTLYLQDLVTTQLASAVAKLASPIY
jgi:Fic family protein